MSFRSSCLVARIKLGCRWFLKLNDFTGKTIVPFATSSSSGFSTRRHEALAFGATWMQGQRFSSRATSSQIETWIDGLNLNIK